MRDSKGRSLRDYEVTWHRRHGSGRGRSGPGSDRPRGRGLFERLGSLDLLVCSAGTLSVHPVEELEPVFRRAEA